MAKIVLAITGSVAAPKALMLYEKLREHHEVVLIVTPSATKFLQSLPLSAAKDIFTRDYYDKTDQSEHIQTAKDADLFVCYPATHHFVAQVANGLTDNLAALVYSASNCYKMIFPAMNTTMYNSPANHRNLHQLIHDGVEVLPAKEGLLACNTIGIGRAWEPNDVLNHIENYLNLAKQLACQKITLNFGRTRVYIDSIRYITNNSTGQMGKALGEVLVKMGCDLTAIRGDVDEEVYFPTIYAQTNQEMLELMLKNYSEQDIVICCAALNDYNFAEPYHGKIKKRNHPTLNLELKENIDVLKVLGEQKQHQFLVGFSAQDEYDLDLARGKLREKNLDLIVINLTSAMGQQNNEVILLTDTTTDKIALQSKPQIAREIIKKIVEMRTQ